MQICIVHTNNNFSPFHTLSLCKYTRLCTDYFVFQTDRRWPYGQEVMLRQINRVLVANLADWVGVPRSGSLGRKQTTRSWLSPCGDELIGWVLAQVKPSATCSLSLSSFTLPPTDSLRGSSRCLLWTTCCLLLSMGFSCP